MHFSIHACMHTYIICSHKLEGYGRTFIIDEDPHVTTLRSSNV